MLSAYYSKGADSQELFSRFKIAKEPDFEKHLNKFNVIKLDINSELRSALNHDNLISEITQKVREEFSGGGF